MTSAPGRHGDADTAAPFHPLAAFSGPVLDNLMRTGEAYAKACLAWQEEILRFVGARVECARDAGESLAKCESPGDFAELQKTWMMTAAQDYFEGANRLAQLTYKLLPSWLPPAVIAEEKPHPIHNAA